MDDLKLFLAHIVCQCLRKYVHPEQIENAKEYKNVPVGSMGWNAAFAEFLKEGPLAHAVSKRNLFAQKAEETYLACIRNKIHILLYSSEHYPPLLRHISDPPMVLFAQGNIDLLKRKKFAVIGSRKALRSTVAESVKMGQALAEQGYVCVSGGAFGADIASHYGVLSSGILPAPAITVFAGGLAKLHPRGNSSLFRELFSAGALFVSERLWAAPAAAYDFPVRNRIISGLCEGVFVMQAGIRSGALVTALAALNQGREVYTLEHDPLDPDCAGTTYLIGEGSRTFANTSSFFSCMGEKL